MSFDVSLKEMREEAVPLLGGEPSRQRTASIEFPRLEHS